MDLLFGTYIRALARFPILSAAYTYVCMCVHTAHTAEGGREQRSFPPGQKLGRSVWFRSLGGCFKVESESKLLLRLEIPPSRSCISYSLLSIWSRGVIDFSPTIHSPLNNAPRSAGLEIIGCPWHPWRLSPLRVVSRPAESPRDIDGCMLPIH